MLFLIVLVDRFSIVVALSPAMNEVKREIKKKSRVHQTASLSSDAKPSIAGHSSRALVASIRNGQEVD